MSIAREEANNLYSKPNERTIGRSNLFDFEELRSYQRAAYQRGRTAEPTEAEIVEAAKALMSYSTNWAALKPVTQADIDRQWDSMPEYQRENWRAQARAALRSARKAVTK